MQHIFSLCTAAVAIVDSGANRGDLQFGIRTELRDVWWI